MTVKVAFDLIIELHFMILFNTHFSTRPVLSMPMTITDDDQRGALLNDDRDADDDLVLTAYAKPCLLLGLSVAQRWSRIIYIIIISIIKIIVIVRPGTTHSSQQQQQSPVERAKD